MNPGAYRRTVVCLAAAALLRATGLAWTAETHGPTGRHRHRAHKTPPDLAQATKALDVLEAQAAEGARRISKAKAAEIEQAADIVVRAAAALPQDDKVLLPRLRRLEEQYAGKAVPTPNRPLGSRQGLERLLLTMQLRRIRELPPEKVSPHPAAAAFPGAVPAGAKRVTRNLSVDTGVPGWHSTGLYAAPGEIVEVTVPRGAAGKELYVRIGAHKDSLWHHDSWRRCPEVTRRYRVDAALTRGANAFGGLVYVEVPDGCRLGRISVRIANAVQAPHFVLGRTNLNVWKILRNLPAPWAELETSKIILTVPASAVRRLDDPVGLMKFWDRVADCCAELAARPTKRTRPERYVADTQISAGYMHSGYPIMTLLDAAAVMVDRPRMAGNRHGGVWGLFHELGHNHQSRDWTFDGAVEVTVNLFTLYVLEKACGRPVKDNKRFSPREWSKRMDSYFTGSRPDFEKWKRDPFLALQMYIQMQQAFGWQAFRKVFAEYRDLPAERRPRRDDEKRDQWMVRFSRTVGRNLGPFFEAWGVPTSTAARRSVARLPVWMPKDFPPTRARSR